MKKIVVSTNTVLIMSFEKKYMSNVNTFIDS